ncbi:MAG: gliding motility-associated C-terminal domain-containing protein [Bacteroidota bacterium]
MMRSITLFFALIYSANLLAQDCTANISIGQDTMVCSGTLVQFQASNLPDEILSYNWTPADDLFVSFNNELATSTITAPITFGLEVRYVVGPELVFNGDFTEGDTGFTTEYEFGNSTGSNGVLDDEGLYRVVDSPQSVHQAFANCNDHTPGDGNMMVVNGGDEPVNVWCQDISVDPGVDYAFSAWVTTVVASSPAVLQFRINGNLVGDPLTAPNFNCFWEEFFALWNSGTNSSAEICISNLNTASTGNDFAIDDISFRRTCLATTQRTVEVAEPALAEIEADDEYCVGTSSLVVDDLLSSASTTGGNWSLNGFTVPPNTPLGGLPSGSYNLRYEAGLSGCGDIDLFTFEIVEPANAGVPIDEGLFCQGESGTFALPDLLADFDAGGSWALPPELAGIPFSPVSGVADLSSTSAGSYDFTYTVGGANACPVSESVVTVEVAPVPTIDSPLPDAIIDCNLPELVIRSGADPQFNVSWQQNGSPFANGDEVIVTEPGTYTYTLTNPASGCASDFEFTVTDERTDPVFDIDLDSLRCSADNQIEPGRVELIPTAGRAPYLYSVDGQTFQVDSTFEGLQPGTYELTVEDLGGCRSSRSITLIDPLDFDFALSTNIGPDFLYGRSAGVFVQTNLPPSELANLSWLPLGVADTGSRSIQFVVVEPTTVQALLTTSLGCQFDASISLSGQNGPFLFAPSAFSPNDDGVNDRWMPFGGLTADRLVSVEVFDRWGSPVFQKTDQIPGDLQSGWDGRWRGEQMPVGVYVFSVEVLLLDGTTQQETGSITLVR